MATSPIAPGTAGRARAGRCHDPIAARTAAICASRRPEATPCDYPIGVDLLFDGAGGQTRDQALDAVRDGGRAISIVLQGTPLQPERGITGESFAAHGGRPRLEQLAALVDAGKLRPQAETVLPLDQAREALARVAARHTRGKIALQIS
jgi:NADPH2:quinone reductase